MQQRILAFPSLAAGSEGDTPTAWSLPLYMLWVSGGSLTSPTQGLSAQVRKHYLYISHFDKRALWHKAIGHRKENFHIYLCGLKEEMKCYYFERSSSSTDVELLGAWESGYSIAPF